MTVDVVRSRDEKKELPVGHKNSARGVKSRNGEVLCQIDLHSLRCLLVAWWLQKGVIRRDDYGGASAQC
mgnify:CR=1 FL=1